MLSLINYKPGGGITLSPQIFLNSSFRELDLWMKQLLDKIEHSSGIDKQLSLLGMCAIFQYFDFPPKLW